MQFRIQYMSVERTSESAQPELLLWAGSVRPYSLEDRIRAAQIGGFAEMSLFPWDVRREVSHGRSVQEMRQLLVGAGLRTPVLDPLTTWLTGSRPTAEATAFELEFARDTVDEVFAMAAVLGAELICVSEFWGVGVDRDRATQEFAVLCDRAASEGLRVALEPMPFSGIPDLATAWVIAGGADRVNGGLMLDSWHFFRRGPDLELLESVPGEKVFALQLNDAPVRPNGDVKTESMHERLLPGEGELPLNAFLAAIGELEPRCFIGPEIFNEDIWGLGLVQLAKRLQASTSAVLGATSPPRQD